MDNPTLGRRTLLITSAAVFMVSLEITIIALAFPQIEAAFPTTSEATLSWVITAYNIGVASLLLLAGWWADNAGRKKVFLIGLVAFAAGSMLAAFAWSAPILIGSRILQSVGGAIQYPAGLALLLSAFPPERRPSAIGIWGAMGALAAALGPSVGGLLVEAFGWRSIFAINVPVALVAAIVGRRWLEESRLPDAPARVDVIGVPLASLGIGAILLGVVQAESLGPGSPAMIGLIVLGVVMVAAFVLRSRRHPHPLFDLRLFSIRSYAMSNALTVIFVMAFFSWLVTIPSFVQEEWGWSVLRTGFAIAPGPLVAMVISLRAGGLSERIGAPPILAAGGLVGAVGLVWQRVVFDETPNYVIELLVPNLLIGFAAGCSFALLVATAMQEVPPSQFGMAGAGRTTIFQLGVAAGVAMGFAITAGAADTAEALTAMRRLFVVCAVLYLLQFVMFARFFPSAASSLETT